MLLSHNLAPSPFNGSHHETSGSPAAFFSGSDRHAFVSDNNVHMPIKKCNCLMLLLLSTFVDKILLRWCKLHL